MQQTDVVELILQDRSSIASSETATAFAPTNIALVKYWGKRDSILNLPITDSLSISLDDKGARTSIALSAADSYFLNGELLSVNTNFSQRLTRFLDLFRFNQEHYEIHTELNIPLAAGLASSACGFAALVKALDKLYDWKLDSQQLSILARLGSGSACRSIHSGFVWWQKGTRDDGMDSCAIPITTQWPELRIGLLLVDEKAKTISSREAMQQTIKTSYLYENWPQQVAHDLSVLDEAILSKDFSTLGKTSEHNALSMHATMSSAWPPIVYSNAESLNAMHKIWQLRQQGLELYFTQDAGPNLKLLFLEKDQELIVSHFSKLEIIKPFNRRLG